MKDWKEVEGWIEEEVGPILAELAKDKVCVEVGSYKGKSSCAIGSTAKHLHCVDLFKADNTGIILENITTLDEFKENTVGYPITYYVGDSKTHCDKFENDSIDLIFIDSSHKYVETVEEINCWWDKVKIGGTFCFHDCLIDSVPETVGLAGVGKAVLTRFKVEDISGIQNTLVWFNNHRANE